MAHSGKHAQGGDEGVRDLERARELAEQIFRSYDIQTRPKSIIADIANLLLPLIRDQGRHLRAQQLVDEQAKDESLWCIADSIVEAYVQQELRRLHAAIEDAAIDKARGDT